MSTWQALKKVVKPKTIFFIIILLTANTFAWFIYNTMVDVDINARIRAWNIQLEAGDNQIVDYLNIEIEDMFPGMAEFHYLITAQNHSEVNASVIYTLLELDLVGHEFITIEGRVMRGEPIESTDLSSDQLIDRLANFYPFSFVFDLNNNELEAGIGIADFDIKVNWPFESGRDAEDTFWGIQAANYRALYPTRPSITLKLRITISQTI